MADTQETAVQRIENIINDLQIRIFEDIKKIEAIAQEEQERCHEGSKGAMRWYAFGGDGAISDTFTAERLYELGSRPRFWGRCLYGSLNRDKDAEL